MILDLVFIILGSFFTNYKYLYTDINYYSFQITVVLIFSNSSS